MKNAVFALMCLMVLTAVSYGQESASPSMSKEDVKQIREAAEGLRTVFGIEDPKADGKKDDQKDGQKKTIVDVADKAVDMAGRMVSQAAESIEKVAPEVWRIMIRQQYVKAVSGPILPCLLLVVVFAYYNTLRKWCPDPKQQISSGDNETGFWCFQYPVPLVAGVACGVWACIAFSMSVKYLINPEFYAIRDMLMMILNKGNGVG